MVRKRIRTIRTLIIGLALAGCGAQAAPTSPEPTPRPTSQPAAQASPVPPSPVPARKSPATAVPSLAAPTSPPAAPPALDPGSAAAAWLAPTATPPFPEQQITAANVGQIELLRTVGVGQALDAAFSPDQRLLAVGTSGGIAWYALPSLEHLRFDPIAGGAGDIQFVDGQTVESVRSISLDEQQIERRRVADAVLLEARSKPPANVGRTYIFDSPASDLQARFALPDSSPVPGVKIVRLSDNATLYEDEDSLSIAFAADGATVALVTYQGIVRVVDLLSGHAGEVFLPGYDAVAFSPDGQLLVTAGRQLNFWDAVSGELVQNDDIPNASDPHLLGKIQRLRYTADGSGLTIDGSYAFFDAIARIGSSRKMAGGQVSPGGGVSVSGPTYANGYAYVDAISPANQDGAFTDDGFTLQLQRANEPRLVLDRQTQIKVLEFSPDGGRLAIADAQGAVDMVNVEDGSAIQSFGGNANVSALAFSDDGALLAGVSNAGAIQVWETATGRTAALMPDAGAVARPVFASGNELMLAPSQDGVRFYRLSDGALLHTLPAAYTTPASLDAYHHQVALAIGPRRRMVAVLHDGYIELWGIR